ncbi:chemotaxis-specific protein-glutamate methyltransferase CheB [Altererythrobacter sp. JGD-16]|uniref:protein-glutamate methylesterase n=1 Tax=Altererythrobacter lutimaris TaxID=2743979 RepID=A0A850H6K1_9SPHN|nr:chemotaxis-specific protein-glutamate methyltransferase CheB [Altererythrobacter lutimaris]NVE94874.1 chemotaxis-specific protein-glutamate methyltransferase CheB [Altererythrobacter lutimaris]
MIVDDSLTVRTIFSRMVQDASDMMVVAGERTAELALARLRKEAVDVILLDLEMPGMGGLEALPQLLKAQRDAQVLVVSSLTNEGAEATMAALSMGAADTMLKPRPGGFDAQYRSALLEKIRALGGGSNAPAEASAQASNPRASAKLTASRQSEIIAIGASTGGIHALNLLLRTLKPEYDLPICITQHLPTSFVSVFARQLEVTSARRAVIAEDGAIIQRGEIAVATGHSHMLLEPHGQGFVARTSSQPAASGCMPSVDPMLSSLARNCDGRATAILLSGMGKDGVLGAGELVSAGGTVLAQDAETSAVWGMPGAVANAGLASAVLPPEKLAERLMADRGLT